MEISPETENEHKLRTDPKLKQPTTQKPWPRQLRTALAPGIKEEEKRSEGLTSPGSRVVWAGRAGLPHPRYTVLNGELV